VALVDHKRRFVFIHVPRTGGNSAYRLFGVDRPPGPLHDRLTRIDGYFAFGFVRNPWARMYSCYRRQRVLPYMAASSFKHYLFDWLDGDRLQNSALWYLDGADYIARFENINSEWRYILARLNMPVRGIPHLNQYGQGDYRRAYDAEMVDFIATRHADDIAYGSYRFE
jgi:hypothetical protein